MPDEIIRVFINVEDPALESIGNVPHIGDTLPEEFVVDSRECADVFVGGGAEGPFDIHVGILDSIEDLIEQSLVFKDQKMGVKNSAILSPKGSGDLFLDFHNLMAGSHESVLKPCNLAINFRRINVALGYGESDASNQTQGTVGDSVGHGYPGKNDLFH